MTVGSRDSVATVGAAADYFRGLYLSAPCGLLTMGSEGHISEVNDTFVAWTGLGRDTLVGTPFGTHLDESSQVLYESQHLPVLLMTGQVREVSLTLMCASGQALPVLLNAELHEVDGTAVIHMAVFDATSRQEYERDLLAARRSAEASEARVLVLQEATAAFAQSFSETEVAEALLAAAASAFAPTSTGVFFVSDDGFTLIAGEHPLDGKIPIGVPLASDSALDDGAPVTVSSSDESGRFPFVVAGLREKNLEAVTVIPLLRRGVALGVLACFFARRPEFDEQYENLQASLARQASQAFVRVRLQHELERLALHDQLTGLANRGLLQDTVTTAVHNAGESALPLSVIFLDLDGFKGINDVLGHVVGDSVLREIAGRVRLAVRQQDTVGRYGGDEFVVVCEAADELAALSIADRIRDQVALPITGIPAGLPITASVGIATWTPNGEPAPSNDELLSLADTAMYQSKSDGKDRVSRLRR